MNVQPVILEGPSIRLEPLGLEHIPRLWPRAEPDLFQHMLEWPRDASLEAFDEWVLRARQRRLQRHRRGVAGGEGRAGGAAGGFMFLTSSNATIP
jgi:hypothetical protein